VNPRFESLVAAVQANCHVTDARHARGMTLCTYLLEMREFYRWEQRAAPTAALPRAEVGEWISGREALWAEFEDAEYRRLPLAGGFVDPFDAQTVNRTLVPNGFVYGAGVSRFGKPQFFVGALEREEWREGVRILVTRDEFARDLAPAPGALREGTIYVRLEALQRVLWEKAEVWAVKCQDGALRAALDAHGFNADAAGALASMTEAEGETVILHELGEHRAARALGPEWERMLAGLSSRRAELFVRAARDHLADCTTTLPALLDRDAVASLHFWFANLDGMRREIFPAMPRAYDSWCGGDGGRALRAAADAGAAHWRSVCADVLAVGNAGGGIDQGIEALAAGDSVRL
jgi:hypothetical protein